MKLLHRLLLLLEWCSYRSADLVITTNVSQKRNALERESACLSGCLWYGMDLISNAFGLSILNRS